MRRAHPRFTVGILIKRIRDTRVYMYLLVQLLL